VVEVVKDGRDRATEGLWQETRIVNGQNRLPPPARPTFACQTPPLM
jgi:hypothetical protein